MTVLTSAMEDYLRTLYKLEVEHERVTTSLLAEAMDVRPASATNMLKRLAELKLVEHEPYRGVALTPDGRRAALEIVRHHRLLELYLQHALGYSWDKVDAEAERLEHAVTGEFIERIEAALGHPTRDPHGHPIPSRDLEVEERGGLARLSDVTEPGRVRVRAVDDADPERLRALATAGLLPDRQIEVVRIAPADGPLTIRSAAGDHLVGLELARHVTIDAA